MKVIVSLTTIPSRIENALKVAHENVNQGCHEVWVNIPRSYKRFPEWQSVTINSDHPKIIINRECEDLGPATKVFGPISTLKNEDIIVYIDDDTHYDNRLVSRLLKYYTTDKNSAWGLSGFRLDSYFKGMIKREHGMNVDVLEGYGGVLVKAEWISKIMNDFLKLKEEAKFADDIVISNLLQKHDIGLKTVFVPELHIGMVDQYLYGFGDDALHKQTEGGHKENYKRVIESLKSKNMFYFKC
jgi:hypothetical protein